MILKIHGTLLSVTEMGPVPAMKDRQTLIGNRERIGNLMESYIESYIGILESQKSNSFFMPLVTRGCYSFFSVIDLLCRPRRCRPTLAAREDSRL